MTLKPIKNEIENHVIYMGRLINGLRAPFKENGDPLPENIQGHIGFGQDGKKGKPTCEVLYPDATGGVYEIIVRSDQDVGEMIAKAVAHACLHIVTGPAHNQAFRDAANRQGFDISNGLKNAMPGPKLLERLHALVEQLGPVPHTKVIFENLRAKTKIADSQVADGKVRQVARMRKAECIFLDGEDRCGYTVRVARSWVDDVGAPHCPRHGEMMVHWQPGDRPEETGITIAGEAEELPELPKLEAAE